MNCKFCNAPMEDGQEICPVCGKNVTEETASENAFTIEAEDEESQAALDTAAEETLEEAPKKKVSAKTVIGWVVAIVLVLAIAACAMFVWKQYEKSQLPVQDVTVQGGLNYTVANEEMTEEKLQTVVASVEKNGLLRAMKEAVGMTGTPEDGLTNAQLSLYYWDSFYNFYNTYGYYAMMMGLDPMSMDTTEYQEGQTWQEFFLSQALNLYRAQTAVCAKAEAEGYVLSEELESELSATEESLRAMEDIDDQLLMVYGPGVDFDSYMAYLRQQYVYSGYLTEYQENVTYTDEELSAYYDENAESYEANGVVKTDAGEAVDSLAEAEKIYAEWQAGEATEESFAALAAAYTTDPGSQETGGLYENVYEGQMVAPFEEWCFDEARQVGDTGIVETDYGHHVMYFVSKNDDGTVNVRHILTQSVDPDAWKETVAEDLTSHKVSELIAQTSQDYAMDLDLAQVALTLPGQITASAEETTEVPTTETETAEVTP